MTFSRHALAPLAAGLTLGACAAATTATLTAPLGPEPSLGGGSYSTGGGVTVAADVREHDGRAMVCGVWAQSRQQSILTNLVEMELLGTGSVYLGDEAVVRGLNFMHEVKPTGEYAGAPAGCVVTERPWTADDGAQPVAVYIPRQVVEVDADDMGGGIVVYFYQTGPGAEA